MKPELGQRRENDGEIPSVVGGKKSGNVLNEQPPSGSDQSVSDSCELEEQTGPGTGESGASAGDGEVLAGEPSAEKINGWWAPRDGLRSVGAKFASVCVDSSTCSAHVSYVFVDGDSGPMSPEHPSPPRVGFAEELMDEPRPRKTEIHSAHAAEQGAAPHLPPTPRKQATGPANAREPINQAVPTPGL